MIILKLIGYSILYAIGGAILFFCIGLYFEIDTRPTEEQLNYDNRRKEYRYENVVVEEDISGNITAYFTIAGILLGALLGIIMNYDTSDKQAITPPIENSSAAVQKEKIE